MRLTAIGLVAICLGLPINRIDSLLIFLASSIAFSFSRFHYDGKRVLGAFLLSGLTIAVSLVWPAFEIEEGHNIFLPAPKGQILQDQLPPDIYQWMNNQFQSAYPSENHCFGKTNEAANNCWKTQPGPDRLYAQSADGFWQDTAFSRIVSHIDFNDLGSFRGGFVNDLKYNWYDQKSDVTRDNMPYWVMYRFSENAVGKDLCWRGHLAWIKPQEPVDFIYHADKACKSVTPGLVVYGSDIVPETSLSMTFFKTTFQSLLIVFQGILVFTIATLLIKELKVNSFLLCLGFVCVSLTIISTTSPILLSELPIFAGGMDGRTHDGFSRLMLEALKAGNLSDVFQGGSSVFYYMPGMRYLRLIDHVVFGESLYLGLIIVLVLPYIFYRLFRLIIPPVWCVPIFTLFYLTLILRSLGLSYGRYIENYLAGFPGTLAYGFFVAALVLGGLLYQQKKEAKPNLLTPLVLGFCLFISVFLRPNLAPGAGVFLLGLCGLFIRTANLKSIWVLSLGFAPILFVPFHNWFYGGVFVPFTSAATASVNLHAPPSLWMNALMGDDEAGQTILTQLSLWSKGFHPLHLGLFACVIGGIFYSRIHSYVRLIALIALAQHSVLLVFTAHSRYAWLAWLLSAFVSLAFLRYFIQKSTLREKFERLPLAARPELEK